MRSYTITLKNMKILIVDTYYPGFLKSFYSKKRNNFDTFRKQKNQLLKASFGTSDYYSYNLKKLGHQAEDLIINDEKLQLKWAREHNLKIKIGGIYQKIQLLPFFHRFIGRPDWVQEIALEQIKEYRPDVLYIQDLSALNPDTLLKCKKYCKLVVGQIACPLPSERNLLAFDLILTSFPHYVERFKKMGINSEYFKIGFDERILKKIGKQKRIYPVTFIGSFSPHHQKGTKILEDLAKLVPIHIWGQGINFLGPKSPLRKHYHGEAWGLEMYKILAKSKIVLNRHISASEKYANNMRLYESTGMGAMLITDDKKNLGQLFDINKEVVAYKNINDLINKVNYYLKNSTEIEKIALKGQKRTINEHSYKNRMKELTIILNKYIK